MSEHAPAPESTQSDMQDALENLHRTTGELETLVHRLVPLVDELEQVPDRATQLIEQLFQYLNGIQELQTQTVATLNDTQTQLSEMNKRLEKIEKTQEAEDQKQMDSTLVEAAIAADRASLERKVDRIITLLEQTVSPH
jgi:ABC-type transporter Mla subunit MlaD